MPTDAAADHQATVLPPSEYRKAMRWSRSWRSFKTSSGETLGATLVKDGFCLVPRGDMAGKLTKGLSKSGCRCPLL
jgi:hypothetical protein